MLYIVACTKCKTDTTEEKQEATLKDLQAMRRRCFAEARLVTQHVASASTLALAAHALDELEQGETHAFLRGKPQPSLSSRKYAAAYCTP